MGTSRIRLKGFRAGNPKVLSRLLGAGLFTFIYVADKMLTYPWYAGLKDEKIDLARQGEIGLRREP